VLQHNRLFLDAHRCVIGDHARQHQREDDLIIERDLEDHDDSHDRSVSGGRQKCAHADERKRTGNDRKMGEQMVRACAEQNPKLAPINSVGVNTPPTAPERK